MPIVVTGPVNREVLNLVGDGTDPRTPAGFVTDPRRAVVIADDRSGADRERTSADQHAVTVRAYEARRTPGGLTDFSLPLVEVIGPPARAFLTALRHAEERCRSSGPRPPLPPPLTQPADRDVVLVGAGIVNLITAWYLARAGYRLRILDARPDPRTALHWSAYGCTRAGGDARMFTLTEADDYHAKAAGDRLAVNGVFRRSLGARGWNVRAAPFTAQEERWVSDFEAVPGWLAQLYNEDIMSFNRESRGLWRSLIQDCPELFQDAGHAPGILRLYTDQEQFEQSALRHRGIGALRRVLGPAELRRRHPGLASSTDDLVGGLEVPGFTVNVHAFMARLISRLEQAGAVFGWATPVERIERGRAGGCAVCGSPASW